MGHETRSERGQATVEWVGLVSLVLALFAVVLAVGPGLPGVGLARAIAAKLACAVRLADGCAAGSPNPLVAAYGDDLAKLVRDNAPELVYEADSSALPVDFRSCRGPVCGNGQRSGAVRRSNTGEPAAAFVHVVDCRAEASAASERSGFDCSGERAGNVYVQYWLYYEDSVSLRDVPGDPGFHQDDWESFQVRISPAGVDDRASSHHGYNYDGGIRSWLSDAGIVQPPRLGPGDRPRVRLRRQPRRPRARGRPERPAALDAARRARADPDRDARPRHRRTRFAITPPWRKPVYRDPEDEGT